MDRGHITATPGSSRVAPRDRRRRARAARAGAPLTARGARARALAPGSKPADLPVWNYDGSSTNQAPGSDSEVLLKPVAVYDDPFRGRPHVVVLCENYLPDPNGPRGLGAPLPNKPGVYGNTRAAAEKIMKKCASQHPWFGIEQEYTLFERSHPGTAFRGTSLQRETPYGWPKAPGRPKPQGPYYCSIGAENAFGRRVAEAHYKCCLAAGIKISGINGEVMPGQWEYQVGPCDGIEAGDQLWMSRYFLVRVCEEFGIVVTFDPKPIAGDWNGAGCHTNVSTDATRRAGGYAAIEKYMERLGAPGKQQEHIQAYDPTGGEDNKRRLTGKHETASIHQFKWGVADRGASVRIPRMTEKDKRGYFEDRRPASNMDPYSVTAKIMETVRAAERARSNARGARARAHRTRRRATPRAAPARSACCRTCKRRARPVPRGRRRRAHGSQSQTGTAREASLAHSRPEPGGRSSAVIINFVRDELSDEAGIYMYYYTVTACHSRVSRNSYGLLPYRGTLS